MFARNVVLLPALLVSLLGAIALQAQEKGKSLETEELKLETGHEEPGLGARIHSIEEDEQGIKVTVSAPARITDGTHGDLEEITVLGKAPERDKPRPSLIQIQRHEVINDLEEGRSGLVFYLGKQEDFVLKFNYTDDRPTVEPDLLH
ncbi:hypothetical protein [Pseudomaricurvus sp. HS19]|uniref:hypothetical protein n=1 Tax=Pseudomaricurvus sp. HS19 TaxID=2692626 RepID=UPI0013707B7A|nr:hypothetical protein [Pseudomaricurvus sp. HS19]MYM62572.1 hypothetical protein [Pseudomaricurvus sp. HS19]